MKKNVKKFLINTSIILVVLIIATLILKKPQITAEEKTAICLGEKSTLYIQLGCHACETQEKMFGESYSKLNVVDCYYEREKCIEEGITGTPTWKFQGDENFYIGVQSIEELKEISGC